MFSHYGPVDQVSETLDRSAEEINVWVEETRRARAAGLDLDHAVAMVRDRTMDRYAATSPDADPALAERFERVSSARGNVEGIMQWLDKTEPLRTQLASAHACDVCRSDACRIHAFARIRANGVPGPCADGVRLRSPVTAVVASAELPVAVVIALMLGLHAGGIVS